MRTDVKQLLEPVIYVHALQYFSKMLITKWQVSVAAVSGAVHKVHHARGGRESEQVWQFVTGVGVKSMWRHAYKFFIVHMKHEI